MQTTLRMGQQGVHPLLVHLARVEKYTSGPPPVVRQTAVKKIITGSIKSNNPTSTSEMNLLKC